MKNLINKSPFLYSLYYHLYRKHRGIRPAWFDNQTQLYFDGYPRSGNTFLAHFIRNLFPELKSVHHLHRIAPIKISLSRGIPTFILIRDPKEAITSNYLKHFAIRNVDIPKKVNIYLLIRLTKDYLLYYNYVLNHKDEVEIIPFSFFIKNPKDVLEKIAESLNETFDSSDIKKAEQTYRGATDKLGSSKPTAYKQKLKDELIEYLINMKDYSSSVSVYEKILQFYNV